jgi:glycosyltransferase involved in cell wall biosynthesis
MSLLNRFVPTKFRDFLIEARAPAQAQNYGSCIVLASDWYALWHKRRLAIPIFHGGYGLTLRHAPPPTFLGRVKTELLWWLQRRAAARAPIFIAVSHEAMAMFGLPHGRVIFNGLDLERINPVSHVEKRAAKVRLGLDDSVVLMAGRWSLEKRLETVHDLPVRVGRQYLVCIPDEEEAHRFADTCKGRRDILVRSFPRGIPEDVWSAADLVYMPSRYEGCSLFWIESAARGLPVVATSVGHLIELVEEHPELSELLLDRNDLAPAVGKIDIALGRSEYWRGRMRTIAECHHDIRKIGGQLEALLRETVTIS